MDNTATESEILELENKLLHPTAEPISLPLYFLKSITRDFCNEQELGRGGYGVVYKVLYIVVDDDQFQKEATFLMGIQHQNVVRILGYCAESRWETMEVEKGKGRYVLAEIRARMLCFEYMCNKGLDEYLSGEYSGLEWNKRYNIIKGICRGLDFLHKHNIIHLDLKPQNILLDANMMPKIADFGLSRFLSEQTYVVTINRAGSRGYMAPEYIDKGVISKKADIFSFGVIVIEILKGCKDDYPDYHQSTKTDFQNFTEKVLGNWRNRFERAANYTELELHTLQVKQCIDTALQCVHLDKEKRPNTSKIIEILNVEEGSSAENGEDLLVDHQMGTHDVQHVSGLVSPNRSLVKDYAPAETNENIWNMVKSVVAPSQPQHEPVLACAERNQGSLPALHYQGARNASFWVAHKALASLEDNLLKDWAATFNLGPSVEALERELKYVKVIIESTLGKVIHNLSLENILIVIQGLVYNAEDMLDEMEYFRIQNVLHNTFDADKQHADEPPRLIFDRVAALQRLKHNVEQMKLVRQEVSSSITLLGSDWSTTPNIAQGRPITISKSIEPKLYGRELMMKSIIDDITKGKHSAEVLTVIPIVGPGGIGKTTLAQHIYHSGEVQNHFDVSVWTCVSLNFNVKKLTEEIQKYIPKVDDESINGTAVELIGQRLKNRRFLLVLDDIWDCSDGDEWKQLLVPFKKSQVLGNIIIVTTRFPAQAHKMVRKNDHSIYLRGLDCKEFEELFLEIIFGDNDQSRKDHTFLLETGFRIAGRLKGSPLAAKTVGRLLKTQLDLVHWTRILESKEWEHCNGKNDIMPALKLSFDYLPSQLQQCFSYCALFPQDYIFEREELINFWIGQEALHSSHGENKRVEDIGLSHLNELVSYGFLENKGGKGVKTCYIIHDILHELARKVSSLEFLTIDSSQSQVSSLKILPSVRHLSINIDNTSVKDRLTHKICVEDFKTLCTRLKVEKLQTLMIFGEHQGCFVKAFGDLFREAKALRVIFLSKASYDVDSLLCNFYRLLHLRYLRIESSSFYKARFPNKISRFYHMMVLDARHCDINDPPRGISNFVKLRHLLVRNDRIHSSIIDVRKLKSLQGLRKFMVKQEEQGFELRQIGHLIDLCELGIYDLQNVQVKEEADEAQLLSKGLLNELILHWDNIDRSTNDSMVEEYVLERLKPSSNLLKLFVKGHRGASCPSWLGTNLSIKSLESLCLDGVSWETFPPIGELLLVNVPHEELSGNILNARFENLRRLELCKLTMVEKWVLHAPCQLFPFLEVLIIKDCPQLVELSFKHIACCQQGEEANANLFPRLMKLKIDNCPQLFLFPRVPWTKAPCSTWINATGSLFFDGLNCAKHSNSVYNLEIYGKKDTYDSPFWNALAFHNLTGLTHFRILDCLSLPLRYLQMLSSLRTLQMSCPSNAFPFAEADSHVKYKFPLESLTITEWHASGKELTLLLTYFPKLSNLALSHCEKITGLGVMRLQAKTPVSSYSASKVNTGAKEQIVALKEKRLLLLPPQLQELQISYCEDLSLCSNLHDDINENVGGLLGLSSLRQLKFWNCPKLMLAYSSSSFPFPNSLEDLSICRPEQSTYRTYRNYIEVLVPLSNLTSLTGLHICNYGNSRGDGLLSLLTQGHLTKLSVKGTPNFFVDSETSQVHEQDLRTHSSKLQELEIDDVVGFTAFCHSLHFSSLTTLKIESNFKVERFTEEQEALLFVNSLEKINFVSCRRLKSLPARLRRLPNLKRIQIYECDSIQMLPEDALPSSLQELEINCCKEIQSLPKDCLPSSLQKLVITNCRAIRSLPMADHLPSSLQELDARFSRSNELRRQCRKLIGIIPIVHA